MRAYKGINAYVLVSNAAEDDLQRFHSIRKKSGVRATAVLTGPYEALVAIGVESFGEVQQAVREIRGDGPTATDTLVVVAADSIPLPILSKLPPVVAFIGVRTVQGRAMDVLQSTSKLTGFLGGAIVAGNFDLLVEIGGKTFDDVARILVEELSQIAGISSTVTSFAEEAFYAR